jgi:glycosyltransferase involved in cell wall biosynthesis
MRIRAFSDVAWPEGSGGVERTLVELYPRLVAGHGAEVCLVTLADRQLPRREHAAGIEMVRARRMPLERITGAQVSASFDVWRTAMRAADRFKPGLVHAHTLFFHTSLVAMAVAKRHRVPFLLTLHLGAVSALPQPYRAATQLYERSAGKALLAAATRVICVSEDVHRHALALGVPAEKLVTVPNGVDAARFQPAERPVRETPVVLSVGRLIFNKGLHFLIEAAAQLRDSGLSFHVQLAGDGPMEGKLRQQVADRGLEDTVTFLGRRDNVESLLGEADIFVRPSLSEGMSLAVLEAMAAGLPLVATDVSGTRQLIQDGVNGLIARPGVVEDLTAALARLLPDPHLRAEFGANARRRALAFDWSAVAESTAKEMTRACA